MPSMVLEVPIASLLSALLCSARTSPALLVHPLVLDHWFCQEDPRVAAAMINLAAEEKAPQTVRPPRSALRQLGGSVTWAWGLLHGLTHFQQMPVLKPMPALPWE